MPVGPSVGELAQAIRSQPLLDVTKPVPTTLGDYPGLYLEVRVRDRVDADACDRNNVAFFSSSLKDGDWWQWHELYVGLWWILDVEGERMVVMPQCDSTCAKDDFDTLTAMAESVTFVRDE